MYGYPYGNSQQMNLNWIVNEIINLHKQLDPDYETPSFSQIYPYSNLNQLNLDWILSELKALKELAPEPVPTELDIQAVAEALVALPFDSDTSYQIYDFISRDGEIWRATEAITAGGDWDETKWFKTKLGTDLAVLERWINAINNSLTAEIEARQQADTALQNNINGLTSANISDDSDAGGANVKLSLNALKGSLNDVENSFASCISGKKVSIIGDSISTFNAEGYKYDGYAMYYPRETIPDVESVNDTWWKRVVDASGCIIEVNASYSGSYITNTDASKPSLCDRCRTDIIGNPDTIIIALGTNDSNNNVAVGVIDYDTDYTQLSESAVAPAYIKGIKTLQSLYPNAQIVCVILAMQTTYGRCIQRIATDLGCKYAICGNYEKAVGNHPNAHGMRQIASSVLHLNQWDTVVNPKQVITVDQMIENGNLTIIDTNIKHGTAPNTTYNGKYIGFRESTNKSMGYMRVAYTPNKQSRITLASNNNENNSTTNTYLTIGTNPDGSAEVLTNAPLAFLKAFGVEYGHTASITAPANQITEVNITFNKEYTEIPHVMISLYANSTNVAYGNIAATVSARSLTGFTVKIYNNDSVGKSPAIYWLAIGS